MVNLIETDIISAPDWWRAWFEADYSWEGLARIRQGRRPNHPWKGWIVVDEKRCVPGIGKFVTKSNRPATLQDYWRADPQDNWKLRSDDELIELGELLSGDATPDSRYWHIAHVPPGPKPGTPLLRSAQKRWFKTDLGETAAWARLEACLRDRLAVSRKTKGHTLRVLSRVDRRAQFVGVVLHVPDNLDLKDTPVHVNFRNSAHLGIAGFENLKFGPSASWRAARFADVASFQDVSFAEKADFLHASFQSDAYFSRARFGGLATFKGATFLGAVEFNQVQFKSTAQFDRASFHDYADFNSSQFALSASFTSACFFEATDFLGATFGRDARFGEALFCDQAEFNEICVGEQAEFSRSRFLKSVDFDSAVFSGDVSFVEAVFAGDIRFSMARFLRTAVFDHDRGQGQLPREVGLPHAEVGSMASAGDSSASLAAPVNDISKLLPNSLRALEFGEVVCLGAVSFESRMFGQSPHFERAVFLGPVSFFGADLHEGAKWQGAKFRFEAKRRVHTWQEMAEALALKGGFGATDSASGPIPDHRCLEGFVRERMKTGSSKTAALSYSIDPVLVQWRAAFFAWRDYAAQEVRILRGYDPAGIYWRDIKKGSAQQELASKAPEYEQAFRRLKRLMREQGAHLEEQRFFACELRARQARTPRRDKDVTWWEVIAARAYGLFSGYGGDLLRPIQWLIGIWIVFTLSYAALAGQYGVLDRTEQSGDVSVSTELAAFSGQDEPGKAVSRPWLDHYLGPIIFSAEITLAPIANPIRHHPWAQALSEKPGRPSAQFAGLRLLHRALSVPLLFLLALTLRRRFQLG